MSATLAFQTGPTDSALARDELAEARERALGGGRAQQLLGDERAGAGAEAGAVATAVYASSKSWAIVIPVEAWTGGIASAILIGAFAGLMPAVRASRMPPTVALRTV